jgi:large subunit ribosomal protein L25
MKLNVSSRTGDKSSDVKSLRRQGDIPAVLYSSGQSGEKITVKGEEFKAILRYLKSGHLATTKFVLNIGKSEKTAIIKGIQYNPTSYSVDHLDFQVLDDKVPVTVKVPVTLTGVAECVGEKLGGFLRPITRFIPVECLPSDMPKEFAIDVRNLGVFESKRLKDIELPKGVKLLISPEEVLVVVSKRKQ